MSGEDMKMDALESSNATSDHLEMTVTRGAGTDELEATLPLSSAEAFLATEEQRSRIGDAVLKRILEEDPTSRELGHAELRDKVMRRTGLSDASAALAVYRWQDLQ